MCEDSSVGKWADMELLDGLEIVEVRSLVLHLFPPKQIFLSS